MIVEYDGYSYVCVSSEEVYDAVSSGSAAVGADSGMESYSSDSDSGSSSVSSSGSDCSSASASVATYDSVDGWSGAWGDSDEAEISSGGDVEGTVDIESVKSGVADVN